MIEILRYAQVRVLRLEEGGIALAESLVAIAIVSTVAVAAMASLAIAAKAHAQARTDITAVVLARSELEYVRSLPLASAYGVDPALSVPNGYAVTVSASSTATCLQLVTVRVARPNHPDFTLEDYKPEMDNALC